MTGPKVGPGKRHGGPMTPMDPMEIPGISGSGGNNPGTAPIRNPIGKETLGILEKRCQRGSKWGGNVVSALKKRRKNKANSPRYVEQLHEALFRQVACEDVRFSAEHLPRPKGRSCFTLQYHLHSYHTQLTTASCSMIP